MASRVVGWALVVLIFTSLIPFGFLDAIIPVQAATDKSYQNINIQGVQTGFIYSQPVDPSGKRFPSSWLDPDGSDFDQYTWDDFTLLSGGTITEIKWYGGYDPLLTGKGGLVVDFTISIYPSTPPIQNLP